MNFYFKFFDIHMRGKGIIWYDNYGFKWQFKNNCVILIDYV